MLPYINWAINQKTSSQFKTCKIIVKFFGLNAKLVIFCRPSLSTLPGHIKASVTPIDREPAKILTMP